MQNFKKAADRGYHRYVGATGRTRRGPPGTGRPCLVCDSKSASLGCSGLCNNCDRHMVGSLRRVFRTISSRLSERLAEEERLALSARRDGIIAWLRCNRRKAILRQALTKARAAHAQK